MIAKLDDHELQTMANFEAGDFWQLLRKVVEADLAMLEDDVRKSPKFSDEDLTEDLRFKMGGVDRLKWILELPQEARNLITKR